MTQELNCSDAAKMLIERMATHPEDFEPGERFWGVMKYLIEGDDIGGFHIMSKRDVEAIMAASQQLHENKLMEYVLRKLLVNDEDPQRDSRLGRASPQKGKITNMLPGLLMGQQGSSLHPDLQYPAPNPYSTNPYPTGGSST
jgi:hypothetical protein